VRGLVSSPWPAPTRSACWAEGEPLRGAPRSAAPVIPPETVYRGDLDAGARRRACAHAECGHSAECGHGAQSVTALVVRGSGMVSDIAARHLTRRFDDHPHSSWDRSDHLGARTLDLPPPQGLARQSALGMGPGAGGLAALDGSAVQLTPTVDALTPRSRRAGRRAHLRGVTATRWCRYGKLQPAGSTGAAPTPGTPVLRGPVRHADTQADPAVRPWPGIRSRSASPAGTSGCRPAPEISSASGEPWTRQRTSCRK
jgi:hypothetical protein